MRCSSCSALKRELPDEQIRSHYDVASYTNLQNEDRFLASRIHFFEFLWKISTRNAERPIARCLDFGSSYGHFLQLLEQRGCEAVGIEMVDEVRGACASRGLTVYKSFSDLPQNQEFDLIALIDSLYCVGDPHEVLASVRQVLHQDGILLIRVTNRNWIIWVLRNVCRKAHFASWFGDATIGYGKKAMRRLLAKNGFTIVKWCYWERGKRQDLLKRMFYWVTSSVTWMTRGAICLSPGILVLAKKCEPHHGDRTSS